MSKRIVYINKMRPKSLGKHFHDKKKGEFIIVILLIIKYVWLLQSFFLIFYAFCNNVMFDFVVKWRLGGATV